MGSKLPVGTLDARYAPSYPAQRAGDALGEHASSLRYDRCAAGTPCPTPHRGVGGVLGKAKALGHDDVYFVDRLAR
jgi:hypothetical protein